MAEREPLKNFERLDELGILRQIHPELRVDNWFIGACKALLYVREHPPWEIPPDFENWRVAMFALLTARLSEEALRELGETLSISRKNMRHLETVRNAWQALRKYDSDTSPSLVANLLSDMDHMDWLTLWSGSSFRYERDIIWRYVTEWRHIKPTYDGTRLIEEKGLDPGPAIGIILRELQRAWLNGEITTPQEEEQAVQRLIQELENEKA